MESATNETQLITPNQLNDSELTTFHSILNNLPCDNVKEKIIIAIDTAAEDNQTNFCVNNEIISPSFVLASAARMLITLKKETNPNHEFFILPLKGNKAVFFHEFTNNCAILDKLLKHDFIPCRAGDRFDLNELFINIATSSEFWDLATDKPNKIPPPFVLRLVLLYNRSYSIPEFNKYSHHLIQKLINSPQFFVDVLVTHNPVSEENNCEAILEILKNIDKKGSSYFFNVGRDYAALTQSVIKLSGHPLQRPPQSFSDYSL